MISDIIVVVCSLGQILSLVALIEMHAKNRGPTYRGSILIIAGLLPIIKIFAGKSDTLGRVAMWVGVVLFFWGLATLFQIGKMRE